jgi:hypothetical protein
MLAIPLAIGLAAAWPPASGAWLVLLAMVLLFLSRDAALSAVSRVLRGRKSPAGLIPRHVLWSSVEAGGAAILMMAAWSLAAPERRSDLLLAAAVTLALGSLHTGLALARLDRTVPGEVLGMAGLASGAPLVVAAAERPLDRLALGAGMAAWLYFMTSLAYVKAVRGLWKGRRGPRRACVAAHAAVAGALALLLSGAFITPLLAAAFVPVFARTAWGLLRPPSGLRMLGWREIAVAILFVLIAIASFAVGWS